jgi:hypothetical protein
MKTIEQLRRRVRDTRGQSLLEFALLTPFLIVLMFGAIEFGYLLLDQHIVTKLTREGSNLISRNTTLQDAADALCAMSARPVDFGSRSKLIFSVLKRGSTTGSANYDRIFLYQRLEYGTLGGSSRLTTRAGGGFGGPPDYEATNSDNAVGLQVTNVAADLISTRGGMIYVTEIYTAHDLLTPLGHWGIGVPTTLYSVAYF